MALAIIAEMTIEIHWSNPLTPTSEAKSPTTKKSEIKRLIKKLITVKITVPEIKDMPAPLINLLRKPLEKLSSKPLIKLPNSCSSYDNVSSIQIGTSNQCRSSKFQDSANRC